VTREKPESELKRLRAEQNKSRQNEVFGGFSPAERIEYEVKSERIHTLEIEILAGAGAEQNARSAKAEQQFQWNKESETDTPQAEAHQPYRSREEDATRATDSKRQQRKPKKEPREKDRE
jgi:hypothetical protein